MPPAATGVKVQRVHRSASAHREILASQPARGEQVYLWGNRAIVVTDIYHRPRAANAEIWQMFDADPAKLAPLGKGWHVNGNPPVHVATGGYELPLLEAFADGIGFFRVAGGIRAYDLRAAGGKP